MALARHQVGVVSTMRFRLRRRKGAAVPSSWVTEDTQEIATIEYVNSRIEWATESTALMTAISHGLRRMDDPR